MPVIEFEHVSKSYHLGQKRGSLREAIAQSATRLLKPNTRNNSDNLLWALDNVSFTVEAGDTLGIIGHNGAGKSTILKLLSKVTFPTRGSIRTKGRIAALIELGAGFHPELSGRENIYLNASILGLKRRVVDACFSDIVEFAGLEKFIDTPVKRYSSGMYVRLAFAVAAHLEASMLLVDEVLAVGDTAFQQKCLVKMHQLRDQGVTIVLVSHNLWTVESFCKRAILLRHGRIETEGLPSNVIQVYHQYEREDLLAAGTNTPVLTVSDHTFDTVAETPSLQKNTHIIRVEVLDIDGKPGRRFNAYSAIIVRTHYITTQPIKAPHLMVQICRIDGLVCCKVTNNREPWFAQQWLVGKGYFDVAIGPMPLVPERYTVETHIIDSQDPIIHASSSKTNFEIGGELSASGEAGVFWVQSNWQPPQQANQIGEEDHYGASD